MQKYQWLLMVWLVAATPGFASVRMVSAGDRAVTLRLDAPTPTVRAVLQGEKAYSLVETAGFGTDEALGGPSLPVESRLIAVPEGMEPVVDKVRRFGVRRLRLEHPVAWQDGRRSHCENNLIVDRDEALFHEAASAPAVEIAETSYLGPLKVALVRFRPVRLRGETTIEVARSVEVRLRFRPRTDKVPVNPSGMDSSQAELFRSIPLNGTALPPFPLAVDFKRDLLLVHASHDTVALAELIRLKEEQGREVRVKFFDKPSLDSLKAVIAEQYGSANPPTHTLIVGSIDQMPSHRRGSYWSDYPFTLIDAGNYPDISLGRIPAQNAAELSAAVKKIIAREREPREDGKFLVTSGYETSWCHVNLKFIMEKIFAKSRIPLSITKLYASEGAKTDRVIEGYNAEPNIIVYDGHGNADGMTEIPLLRQHLPRLTNRRFPLIFDIACLNSYWPAAGASARNFADTIVTLDGKGPAGILAASSNSGGHDLFRHIFRASIFDEISGKFHGINEVGSAVLYGKAKYLEQNNGGSGALGDNQMFYYHGDPASTVFTPANGSTAAVRSEVENTENTEHP